jgi:two-component system CheB/CheR fusion protein
MQAFGALPLQAELPGMNRVPKGRPIFPIVGVGASAGGVEALEGFFQGVPSKPGLAFIVVTHLSPDRESLLHEIIARYTDLTVAVAADGVEVRPDSVYVLPADAIISIEQGRLQVRKSDSSRRERKPIDILFSSLAIDHGEYAACVVLSGGDGDGTLGTKAIKERGGLTLAQVADGHGPRHPSMPDSAISTGLVDFAIPVDEMGEKLVEFARLLAATDDGEGSEAERSQARQEICAILRNHVGHDFSGYKSKTFLRRVQRRMQVTQLGSEDDYVERLKQDPKEVGALFRDLLINVTNFFRDAGSFEKLGKTVVPKLFEGRGAEDTVRVWVPGCATGEEVYSIAILLREHMDTLTALPRVQVFATDIDENALGVARAARYPEAILDSVSKERRERFFVAEGGSYVVAKAVRDLCIFSPHSVIRDPPFSRLDLISCRNLLIYFGPDVQNLVLPTFHYSLRPGGFLFLGMSESVGKFDDLFAAVDKKHRIFRSRDDITIAPRLPSTIRSHAALGLPNQDRRMPLRPPAGATLRQALETQVLERFAPAHVLVTHGGDILHFSARTQKYLELAPGAPTRQLMTLARRDLRLDLRTAFREAVDTGETVVRAGVPVTGEDGRLQLVDITIEPLTDRGGEDPLYIVLFTDNGPALSVEAAQARVPESGAGAALLLERELRDTRERLQSLVEEYETALEELRSSNEELLSVNEEMQSSSEELEASKEELQSLNEELNTVNAELVGKIDALDHANSDLRNLFESTQIPTVFLDRNLVIRTFTPSVKTLFNVLPTDHGRPLTDLTSRLVMPDFVRDIRTVLESGQALETEARHQDAQTYFIVRLAPYRGPDETVEGVVVTFVDVTRLARSQAHQQILIAELNHRVKNMLMVAIGIAQQTHKAAATPEAFLEAYIGRLQAMARSYELLSRENWTESSLIELMKTELAPFGLERLALDGPEVSLKPKLALSLGMVLHELATNAGKYGALSVPEGKVSILWSEQASKAGRNLEIRWAEINGPPVAKPKKRGFGIKLVEKETSYNLGGNAEIEFALSGVSARLAFPLEES